MPIDHLIPSNCPVDRVRLRIGLVSDTHSPQRCEKLPAALFAALTGADLILHAGDVGDLYVLDQLSKIAPVVAVHGNDDSEDAMRELPEQQVVAIGGIRIFLWHSHYPNHEEEVAARQSDEILPKLDRIGRRAQEANATLAIFGHWHIPLCCRYTTAPNPDMSHPVSQDDGTNDTPHSNSVRLINPGAIASPNEITRQLRQTCAAVFVDERGTAFVSHVDLAEPQQCYRPGLDWNAGFSAVGQHYCGSILADDLAGTIHHLRTSLSEPLATSLRSILLQIAHRCWRGELDRIDRTHLLDALANDPLLPNESREQLRHVLSGSPAY